MKQAGNFLLILLLIGIFSSCKDDIAGSPTANIPPETYTVADTIVRVGSDRFTSRITVRWWGDDPDGYLAGFEISQDGGPWSFTTRQDSVFLVEIPPGQDTFDFILHVRAIDNDGVQDPTPAIIAYPVKNSAPLVAFQYSGGSPARNPVKTFPVIKYFWEATDPDGFANIDHFELYLNDTTSAPFIIDAVFSSATLKAVNPEAALTDVEVLTGSSLIPEPGTMPGLRTNDSNVLYIRAVDQVGATSPLISSYSIYVKRVVSKVLLVNAYSTNLQQREDFYLNHLGATGISNVDTLRVSEVVAGNYTSLAADNPTQEMIFALFDVLIWFGSEATTSLPMAQRTTDQFFNAGGKMFIATNYSSAIEEQANFLDFTPIDSLVEPPAGSQFRLANDARIIPVLTGWPELKSVQILSSARPFYEAANTTAIYTAEITQSSSSGANIWPGHSTIMAKRPASGQSNFIISSLELHNLDGNGNMQQFFQRLFVDEFGL
ncbi:MAG: hypothetical protein WD077_03230 [Bacteroidia bacterium]